MPVSHAYFDELCRHLDTLDGFERDWWTGGVRSILAPGVDLYATPGWDGLPGLPWSLEIDGDVPANGEEPVEWTGDLDADAALYRAAVARVAARARAALANAYHRVHWTDANWAGLDLGARSDGLDEPIPGVVHEGDYLLIHARHLDEPHAWPLDRLTMPA